MKVVTLGTVAKFINSLDTGPRSDVYRLVDLLEQYGHVLSMPYTKPIGGGLWELRRTRRPHIRILYGFCRGNAVLILAFKKQRSALRQQDIEYARQRLSEYCA